MNQIRLNPTTPCLQAFIMLSPAAASAAPATALKLPDLGESWGDAAAAAAAETQTHENRETSLTIEVNRATEVVKECLRVLGAAKMNAASLHSDAADLRAEANDCKGKSTWPQANGAACLAERAAAAADAVVEEATKAHRAAIAKLKAASAALRGYSFELSEKRRAGRTAWPKNFPAPEGVAAAAPVAVANEASAPAPVAAAEDAPAEADFTEVGPRGKPNKQSAAHTRLASWVKLKTPATEKKGGVVKVTFGGRVEHAKYTIRVVVYSNGAWFNQIGPIIFPDGTVVKHWFKGNTNLQKVGKFVARHLWNYHNPRA